MKNTICAIVKNESPYLLEWIAYHKAIGIDFFIIYDNLSTDDSYSILKILDRRGIIKTYSQHEKDGGSPQLKAYNHCIRNHADDTDLMTFIDADEFISSAKGLSVKEYVSGVFGENPDMNAMAINWKIFGSSGHEKKAPGFVIERFQRCSENLSSVFKTVVRPKAVQEMFIHFAELKSGYYGDEAGRPVSFMDDPGGVPGSITKPSINNIQLNHYMVKSKEEFEIKRARGNANYTKDHAEKYKRFNDEYFRQFDLNQSEDHSALQKLEEIKSIYKDLCDVVESEMQ